MASPVYIVASTHLGHYWPSVIRMQHADILPGERGLLDLLFRCARDRRRSDPECGHLFADILQSLPYRKASIEPRDFTLRDAWHAYVIDLEVQRLTWFKPMQDARTLGEILITDKPFLTLDFKTEKP